jgi:GNAT superfamily N-acetyltransferase
MTTMADHPSASAAAGLALRPATAADLPACEAIWRAGLMGYLAPMGLGEIPEDNPGLRRLHAHTLGTDPERFWVGTDADGVVAAFGSAVQRGRVWFLSMLFVNPESQARGVGRAILERILPSDDAILSTCTDSAQPISNALYASLGIVPRMPVLNFVGRPAEGWTPPPLPAGIVAVSVIGPEGIPTLQIGARVEPVDGPFAADRDTLDREVLGFDHPADHAFAANPDQRLYAYRDGSGQLVGYGAASLAGRVGPIAVRDAEHLAPIVGHLLTVIEPRGASSIWVAGAAGATVRMLLDARLRIDGFPILLCWSEPFADFGRYLPFSPGLL